MSDPRPSPTHAHPAGLTPVVERNLEVLLERRRQELARRGLQERIADNVSRFAGSMPFVYLHVLFFGGWIAASRGWLPGLPRLDPSLVTLAMFASVEAIFLSTFVLITQNRMSATADRRAELDLQISLLAEHEITRLIELTRAIAAKLDVPESQAGELSELERNIAPEKVLDEIESRGRE